MKPFRSRLFRFAAMTPILAAGFLTLPLLAGPNDSGLGTPETDKPDRPEKSDREDPFRNLTSEQRTELREAVRKAWSDPAVIEARDKLKSAAEAYQNALNSAIKRGSPELAETVDALRRETDSAFRIYGHGPGKEGTPGGPSGGRRGDWRDYEGFLTMENPPFLRDLTPEQQAIYREAHAKAMNASDVKSRLSTLRDLKQSDDEIRKQRIEQIRRVHQAIREAMKAADPRVAEFLPEYPRPGEDGRDRPRPPRPEPPRE